MAQFSYNPEKENTQPVNPGELPIVGDNGNGEDEQEQETDSPEPIVASMDAENSSLEQFSETEDMRKGLNDFIREESDRSQITKDASVESRNILKFFAPVALLLLGVMLIVLFFIWRTNQGILKNLEFMARKDLSYSSGIIRENSNGKIDIIAYDVANNVARNETYTYDDFSTVSKVNLNYCHFWKENRSELAGLAPKRPWYPAALLYLLQWTSLSPSTYPPFPCDRQEVSDRGMIYEDLAKFKDLKRGDYIVVKGNEKSGKRYISKLWKIEPTFMMPLLTDKQ